jgi:DNA-binding transcriptional MocR family regulator
VSDYQRLAALVAHRIAAGQLRPGDRLPTQRAFARRHGVAESTAGRVYAELTRRGLVVGEVGRGTFVRATAPAAGPAPAEPVPARVDLELNYPVLPGQSELLAAGLARLGRPDALAAALRPVTATGRAAVSDLLARPGWRPDPADVLFAGSGRQAVAACLAALVPAGGRLGVEAFTYPLVKALAARLGATLVPLACDADGLLPSAVAAAHREAPLSALYVQPTLHNPLAATMPDARRADLAAALRAYGLVAVEDAIWSFLRQEGAGAAPPPLAAYAPEHVVLADSLSKRLAPGLTLGFAVVPPALSAAVASGLRSGAWTATGFALEAATGWLSDGTAAAIAAAKRADAAERQHLTAEVLRGFTLRADPHSYFCWWDLPEPWRADTFTAAAARHGIAVTPGASFAVGPHRAPTAIRVGLASPPLPVLRDALAVLAAIARRTPEDESPE